eukprot:scaffold12145_cov139-Amphora_coffeaeformis.AAC.4
MAKALFKQAIRVGLFDKDHLEQFKTTSTRGEYLLVEQLDVLDKQMGTVFHGSALNHKSQSALDFARRMGWDTNLENAN